MPEKGKVRGAKRRQEREDRIERVNPRAAGWNPASSDPTAFKSPEDASLSEAASSKVLGTLSGHAATRSARKAMIESYKTFEASFREAVEELRQGFTNVIFPGDCFPPPVLLAECGRPVHPGYG